ncbi:MAG: serine/threonine protein kinase [Chthoniobacterales bacterium]|nr:serine/threonine protein kinase [Chthoniobacterales bacterium]
MGRGGVGDVFLARDQQLDRWVAIKQLHPTSDEAVRRAEAAMAEARHLAALQHPNIVTIYDFLQEEGDILVVMEYVNGRTLEEITAAAPLIFEDFVEVALQCLDGLAAAHSLGMLHRDIKPSNIMLSTPATGRMQVKILDLGLSKIANEPTPQTIDHTGTLLGSIFTMAPEQFEQRPLDARTDLYSLGCVLYQTLAGRVPFEGRTIASVMAAHLGGRFVPLTSLRPDVPPPACSWTERLLAREPDDRPRSATEAAGLLRAILGTTRNVPLGHTSLHYIPEAPAKPKKWILPASISAAAAVILGLGAYFMLSGGGSSSTAGKRAKTSGSDSSSTVSGAAASSSSAKSDSSVPSFAPAEKKALMEQLGKKASVQGMIGRVGESNSGKVRYLNFQGSGRGDLALVFFLRPGEKEFTKAKLERYVGKEIRAEGVISEYLGTPQMQITDFSQIQIIQ